MTVTADYTFGFLQQPKGGSGKTVPFPDPWMDPAWHKIPRNLRDCMNWAEFIWMNCGPYARACQRIGRYFITDLQVRGPEAEEAKEIREMHENEFRTRQQLARVADNFMCFHGDTLAQTADGPRRLRDLAGTATAVLSEGGVYRKAEFKHFGRQQLLEVEFSDGRTVLATPEHQWIVAKHPTGSARVSTTQLKGRRIERTVAPRPEQGEEWLLGVRHGFVFGDGSVYNGGKQAVANFFGEKDRAMLEYFGAGCGQRCEYPEKGLTKIHGFPAEWKQLPAEDASAEYWYGFLCGFLAADGTVDTHGCVVLTQCSRAALEAIERQLPRLGFAAGPLRSQIREVDLSGVNGCENAVYESEIFFLTLLKRFVRPEDLLLPSHRAKFEAKASSSEYGRHILVKDVRDTGIVDDVYCCVEMETHSFVIDQAVLTGNCYGNFFCYMNMPFKRHLRCQCGMTVPFKVAHENGIYDWRDYTFFKAGNKCPNCGNKNGHLPWEVQDEYSTDASDMRVQFLNIHEVEIGYAAASGRKQIHWNIPGYLKSNIDKGVILDLEDTQWEIIEAIKSNDGKFTFDEEMVFHAADMIPDGIYTGGWGIPRVIPNFRLAHQYQTVHRLDQAISDDYIAGMRVVSPEAGTGGAVTGSDPILSIGGSRFRSVVEGMIEEHRRDPASWHVSGFPLKYQLFGGEGTQLVPKELKEAILNEWLDALGFPSQLWHGDLTVQAAPLALRLFENMWPELVSMFNNFLAWQAKFSTSYLGQPEHTISLQPVRFADDIERKQILLQLMAGNQISPQTALRGFGIKDPEEELRLVMEWERIRAQNEKEFSDEMQTLADADMIKQDMAMRAQGAAGGGMAAPMGGMGMGMPGGAPPPGGGGAPAFDLASMGMGGGAPGGAPSFSPEEIETPEAMQATAQRLAEEIMHMDPSARRSALINLKKANSTLHALVKAKIEELENQAGQAGIQQARQGGM